MIACEFGVILNQMEKRLVITGLALALSVGLVKGGELSVRLAKPLGQATRPVTGDAAFSAWTMAARVMLNLDETITRE